LGEAPLTEGPLMSADIAHRMLSSRGEFQDALRAAFEQAATQGCREIWLSDTDFSCWPIGDIKVVEHLTAWAMSHRKLTVLAQHYDDVVKHHPRWATFRRQWSHVVTCRSFEEAEPGVIPSMFLAPGIVTVRLFDAENFRASVSSDLADALRAKDTLDAVLQRSAEAFPATTLGL